MRKQKTDTTPGYLQLLQSGELKERCRRLEEILSYCTLCPRRCGVNRLRGERGVCGAGNELMISSFSPHFGEEAPLVGGHAFANVPFRFVRAGGSGTVFLTHCNLLCCYCQNYEISHGGEGEIYSTARAAEVLLCLQKNGCHNINFVTPTHYAPQLVRALGIAAEKGLNLPLVWNCSGYENVETIRILDGIVDIYMPDVKYSGSRPAEKFSQAPDYWERCRESLKEMHRQVGDLQVDEEEVAFKGMLVRHLVLPNGQAGSEEVLRFIASEISPRTYVNIMAQYRPCGEALKHTEISRRPTDREYLQVTETARSLGLIRGLEE